MDEDDVVKGRVAQWLAQESDRGLGSADLFKHRALAPFSRAGQEAAGNLLSKAADALARDDTPRAERMVARALDLPYDEAEEAVPAAWQAHMVLYMAVSDALEGSEPDDELWLDAALLVLAEADALGGAEMYDVLETVLHDGQLSRREQRRLTGALRGTERRPTMESLGPDAGGLQERILATLRVTSAFEETFASLLP